MAGKTDKITELYQSALKEITSDSEKWTSFLKSACQNFRLPFDEQLLVYVQRPKAKAVLEIGDWNKRFGRTVKKYSTGIAVLDKKSAYPKVKYYFDISDTQESRNAYLYPAVPLWEVGEQHYDDVKEAVINAFGISESSGELDRVILTASKNMAEDHLTDYFHDIFLSRKNSFLEELDEFNVKALVSSLLSNSLAYMLLERCSFDADGYFEREDFQKVTEFNTPELMNIFGTAVSDISETALSVVAKTVRNFENRTFAQNNSKIYNEKADNKADERSFNNGEAELQGTRRSLSSRPGGKASAGGLWEVRISSPAVSNETKVRSVSELSDNGNTQQSSEGDTKTGGGDDGNNRSANDGVTRRDREYQEIADFRLEKELNAFTLEWFKNISNQGYSRNKMIIDYPDFNMTVNYAENNQIVSFTGWDNTSAVPLSKWRKAVKEIAKRYKSPYDIMFSHMGNGVTVCNKLREKYGDYENIAHISTEREVTFYDDKMPEEVRKYIEDFAKYKDMQISASQPESVFSVPPFEKEQHQPEKKEVVLEQKKPVYKNENLSEGKNYRITDMNPSYGGAKHRFNSNIEAVKTLKQCEEENRQALPEEQEILAKYVGWGGLSNAFDPENEEWKNEYAQLKEILTPDEYSSAQETVLTSFYTPPVIIQSVYKVIENSGLKEGNILDPGCGIGNFQGLIPERMKNVKMYGIEQDSVSGRIAMLLYPENQIDITSYENTDLPDNFFDVSVGNIPFGSYQIADKKYDRLGLYVHDYFIVKTLDKLRPGGIMAVITTKGTMDKKSSDVRKYIAQRAELLGAIRLPDNTFSKNAGTRITSDILFLQKRERVIDIEPDWIHLNEDENGLAVNSYFAEHPEMILGKMVIESSPYGMQSACKQVDGTNLEEMLSEAVNKISADIPDYEHQRDEEAESIPADPSVRNFSFTEVNGKLYYRENSRMIRLYPSDTAASRISGMIKIRDCVRNLLEMQADDYPDEDIRKEQSRLNYLYDSYTASYGILNSRANNLAFRSDSSYGLLCSLEILDDEKQFSRKADIFTKRTVKPKVTVNAVDNAYEALALSLNEKGLIDIAYMKSLYGKGMEKLTEELKGKIYQNPLTAHDELTGWETAEEYLSGNVRRKFEAAQKAAETDKKYEENVKALDRVLPKDLGPGDIKVQLGTTWIPSGIIDQFVYELLNPSANFRDKINVKFMESNGEWYVSNKNIDKGNVNAISKYGTKRLNAYWIIESSLNLRTVRVWDKKYDSVTGKESRVLNQKETALAQNKQEIIQQKFEAWIWQDADRRKKLCRIYNDRFNCLKPREYDGSLLTFPEMNPEISLNSHQKNAVARIVFGGNSLIAHAVGGGKTFTMCAACMRLKQLKIASKPMITVLDNTLYDFAAAFMSLYPNANILLATEQDFEKRNRRKFFARIATGEYDAVILTHTQFGKIPISYARQERLLKEEITNVIDAIEQIKRNKGEQFTVKQLIRTKFALMAKLKKLTDQSKKDDIISFEELVLTVCLWTKQICLKIFICILRWAMFQDLHRLNPKRQATYFLKQDTLTR